MGEESINTSGLLLDKIQTDIEVSDKSYKQLRNENLNKIKEHHSNILNKYNDYYTEYQSKLDSDNENNKGEANTRLKSILTNFNNEIDTNIYQKIKEINDDSDDIKFEMNQNTEEMREDNIDELRIKFEDAIEQKEMNIKAYKNQYQNFHNNNQKEKKLFKRLKIINFAIMAFVGICLLYLIFGPMVQNKLKKRKEKKEEKKLFGNNSTKNTRNNKINKLNNTLFN